MRNVPQTRKQRGAALPYTLLELRGFAGRQKGHLIRAHKPAIPA